MWSDLWWHWIPHLAVRVFFPLTPPLKGISLLPNSGWVGMRLWERDFSSLGSLYVLYLRTRCFSFHRRILLLLRLRQSLRCMEKNCSSFSFKIQFSVLSLSCFPCLCGIKCIGVLNEWHGSPSQLYPPSPPPPHQFLQHFVGFSWTIHYVAPNNIGGGKEVKCVFHAF